MKRIFFSLFILFPILLFAQEEARMLRFPSVNGNNVVFSFAGDIYTVSLSGGMARKLTSNVGTETFSRFSPDGKTLAFTAQYDGNTEIYTIPSQGGEPKRITYTATLDRDDLSDRMGPNNIVTSWTPDGKSIIYRSRKKSWNDFVGQLFKVSVNGGISEQLPLPAGGFNSWSPDGKLLAYNRVMREFRTWKYYKGGMADDIWIYDPATKKTENITNNVAQDIFPMWIGNEIYYISDRDRIMNLFCYDTKTKTTKKVTDFKEYDIKFPSHDSQGIIFENGGKLMYYNVQKAAVVPVPIQIANDNPVLLSEIKDASKNVQSIFLAPEGDKIAFGARGEIFIVPAKEGRTINLTLSSGAHDRNPVFSPDGKTLAYLSDQSGEYEIYTQKADGSEPAVAITSGSKNYIFGLKWSPDGKKIMFSNREMKLMYVDITSKKVTTIEQSKFWEITQYNWSPDSKWVVYTNQINKAEMSQIWLYSLETNKSVAVSSEWYSSNGAIFSDDGRYLAFTSDRDFNPTYSQTEWNHAYQFMSRIYIIRHQSYRQNV
jgi:tricorn protease